MLWHIDIKYIQLCTCNFSFYVLSRCFSFHNIYFLINSTQIILIMNRGVNNRTLHYGCFTAIYQATTYYVTSKLTSIHRPLEKVCHRLSSVTFLHTCLQLTKIIDAILTCIFFVKNIPTRKSIYIYAYIHVSGNAFVAESFFHNHK